MGETCSSFNYGGCYEFISRYRWEDRKKAMVKARHLETILKQNAPSIQQYVIRCAVGMNVIHEKADDGRLAFLSDLAFFFTPQAEIILVRSKSLPTGMKVNWGKQLNFVEVK